ncbi:DUF4145 domain-containing protein [uncultured Photobacterium sp.]|uniref:DUF4145 domain-containing protein n=1 Tax=uncultured Photobacterium sp. TaxID=173973 RepID=UPI00263839F2|nr:DUF4145 domain-containing protein [uncultured Photobacterium sp.]
MLKIKAESVRCPRWASEDGTRVSCLVRFNHMQGEHEFIAYAYDCEEHGRGIWRRCVNGDFGEILPYIPNEYSESYGDFELHQPVTELSSFIKEVNSENSKKSFRSVAILWGAMLDDSLKALLLVYKKANPNIKLKINTLNNKISAAYKYKLISDHQKSRCDYIRHIRNATAHTWKLTLDDEKLSDNLKKLYELEHSHYFKYINDLDFLLQMIYAGSCATMTVELQNKLDALKIKT